MKQPKVTRRKVTDYIPDSHNANMGSERGLQMIEKGLNKVGAGRSIVVDAHDKIPAGNKTLEAAVLAGIEDVIEIETDGKALIVHKRTDWDLDDPTGAAREYAYLDNRASEVGLTWDANVIAADVEAGVDLSGMFTQPELEYIGLEFPDDTPPDAGAQIDRADELLQVWKCERGQLWVIPSKSGKGSHRLLCGDSTNADDVARVMGGDRADLMVTDPPYNVARDTELYAQNNSKALKQLAESEWDQGFDPILFLEATKDTLKADCWQYVFTAHNLFGTIFEWLNKTHAKTGFCVWCKPNPMPSLTKRTWTFAVELCLFGKSGAPIFNYPDGEHCLNWWPINKASDGTHPTQKTLEVITHIITHCSTVGQIVNDFFLGSGTTLVACEQTGRLGRGLELEPKYCAVILQRMSDMGLEPKLTT